MGLARNPKSESIRGSCVPGANLFTVCGLTSGNHTVTITVTGTKNSASANDVIALDCATVF